MDMDSSFSFECNAELKIKAAEAFGRWGIPLEAALNAFLVKSVEVGGFPFSVQPEKWRTSQDR